MIFLKLYQSSHRLFIGVVVRFKVPKGWNYSRFLITAIYASVFKSFVFSSMRYFVGLFSARQNASEPVDFKWEKKPFSYKNAIYNFLSA